MRWPCREPTPLARASWCVLLSITDAQLKFLFDPVDFEKRVATSEPEKEVEFKGSGFDPQYQHQWLQLGLADYIVQFTNQLRDEMTSCADLTSEERDYIRGLLTTVWRQNRQAFLQLLRQQMPPAQQKLAIAFIRRSRQQKLTQEERKTLLARGIDVE
eukprot:Protomagalhaensia_sp_Gyna_25__5338@NODE_675_length_2861_cov_1823_365344_g526_i0_p3_GENE_NODE_675_length_2861_cov_1823_365344_g526_i0NODE_675_length_2861_cov_1823_365344_g526_i0_p3_ORF_typecomplete_len158_score13_65DUF2526/PF10735_9/6_4e03DUF2526/PF10735_9/0_51_NODE_675_length_2861_cov_1823_365344_g526_i06871160